MPKPKAKAPKGKVIERTVDPNFTRFYCNTVQIETTPLDFKIRFGDIDVATADKIVVREVATASMSPQHALSFATVFKKSVDEYYAKALAAAKKGPEPNEGKET